MRWIALLCLVSVVGCHGGSTNGPSALVGTPTTFEAENGTTVFSDFVEAQGDAKGVVLMFHQAGSNRHEYDPIAPRVVALGWDCLKVDMRAGGDMWGEANETKAQFTGEGSYLDAYGDMEAALKWATKEEYKRIIVWGSSYSASLSLKLAYEHKNVGAVVAFSPGEYFDDKGIVAGWAKDADVPCFFGATSAELIGDVINIVDARAKTPAHGLDVVYGTKNGAHGSSALREDKNPIDHELYWEHLERFFKSFESGGKNFGG